MTLRLSARFSKLIKNDKAAGPDGLSAEFFKYGGPSVSRHLHDIIPLVWSTGVIPQQWKDASIVMIYKGKGDKANCGNYRGISLLVVAGEVLTRILLNRLLIASERLLPESQCGFRREREARQTWVL